MYLEPEVSQESESSQNHFFPAELNSTQNLFVQSSPLYPNAILPSLFLLIKNNYFPRCNLILYFPSSPHNLVHFLLFGIIQGMV